MNRGEMRTKLGDRFDVSTAAGQTRANDLLDLALGTVWDAREWSFKRIVPTDAVAQLAVTQDATTYALDASVGHVRDVFNHLGDPLIYEDEDTFDEVYRADLVTPQAGVPDVYTVRDDGKGQKVLAFNKKLDAARTFTLAGSKAVHHRTAAGAVTAGLWNDDTDLPTWRSEHHMVVVYEAMLQGLVAVNDPSYDPVAALRDELIERMEEAYISDRPRPLVFRRRGR